MESVSPLTRLTVLFSKMRMFRELLNKHHKESVKRTFPMIVYMVDC